MTSVLRKAFAGGSAPRPLPLRPLACEAAFFVAVLAVAIRFLGAALDADTPVWVQGRSLAAQEIFPGCLPAKPRQLQLSQPPERFVGRYMRSGCQRVDVRWAAVFHCPPQLAQRSFERRLEWQLHRWAGYRALVAHLERPSTLSLSCRPIEHRQ